MRSRNVLAAVVSSFILLSLASSTTVWAETVTVSGNAGSPGAPGADGDPGDPGDPGTNGDDATAVSPTIPGDTSNTANAFGGQGGAGGAGGDGDGANSDGGAGGAGGNGGGGDATASNTVANGNATANATGGTGGAGGAGGAATGTGTPGAGGNGGQGGDAVAASTSNNIGSGTTSVTATSNGGTGGTASSGGTAGNGGAATLGTVSGTSTSGGTVNVTGTANGGDGGAATGTGNAGSGASVTLTDAVDGSTSGALTLNQNVSGGNSGAVQSGSNGTAGTASSSLSKTVNSSSSLTVNATATGGIGGNRTDTDTASKAASGGTATTVASATNTGAGDATAGAAFTFDAVGGAGGRGIDGAQSGDGGVAMNTSTATVTGAGAARAVGGALGGAGSTVFTGTNTEAGAGGNGISSSTATAQSGIANANDDVDGGAGGDVSGSGATNSGSGGVGGDADSTAIASNTGGATVTANANADGAAGGNARGVGNTGGRGGMATATAQGSSTGGATTNVTASATGGAGGGGSDGAAAGAGGGAVVTDATSGSTSGSLSLTQTSSGGGGGNATGGGDGGRGGDASGTLTAGNAEGGTLSMTVTVNGGNGGNANDVGAAGDGGDPTLGPVVGTSPSGGTVTVTGTANGGDGGNATGTGAAGSGASVSVTDRVDGDTTGTLNLNQTVTGGNGGDVQSGLNGTAGDAGSSLSKTTTTAGVLTLDARATGGIGGNRTDTDTASKAASGGTATTVASATNTGAGDATAGAAFTFDAVGGAGGRGIDGAQSGDGGVAMNTSTATVTGAGAARAVGGALGGAGSTVFTGTNTEAGAGGNGISSSTATAQSGIANANDDVDGGAGGDVSGSGATNSGSGGVGGDADSTAIASNTGGATVTANANADGAAGGNARGVGNTGGRGGMATATAQGSSTGGATTNVTASATGGAGGGGSDGAAAGAGGGAVVTDATSGSTSGSLSLTQTSSGGGGGNATGGGDGGRGGDASGTLTAGNAEGGTLSMTVTVNGGNGGNANDVGAAGDGGDPTLGPVVGTSPSGGTVTVTGTANGGDGGNATGTGAAGSGASVSVTDRVDGDTTGTLNLNQTVTGGNGGDVQSGLNGTAGDAGSSLSKTTTTAGVLTLDARATGGIGGNRTDTDTASKAASGGTATTVASATNTGAGDATAGAAFTFDAVGGAGGRGIDGAQSGDGGVAMNTSTATVTGAGAARAVGGALGGAGSTVFTGTNTEAGAGGNGISSSTATAQSGIANANDDVDGGAGGDVSGSGATNSGSGGVGGDADSTAIASNTGGATVTANANADGAAGGNARGVGNTGGRGGMATATAQGSSTGGATTNVTASATGGAGGGGSDGAAAGAGGGAVVTDATSGSTSGSLSLTQTSSGGGGGNATGGGDGGRGGDASGTLTAGNAEGGTLSMTVTVNGGNGGNANDVGAAGDGGDPTLGPVVGTSPSGGTVTVTGTANGGDGGNATGTGAAGSGASVSVTDRVDGDTTGTLNLNQTVTGGNGGDVQSGLNGTAGDAGSSLSKTTTTAGVLTLDARATGGIGGNRTDTDTASKAASGGTATTVASATNTGAGDATAGAAFTFDAVGGAGGRGIDGAQSGDGGVAMNTSTATVTGAGAARAVGGALGGAGSTVFTGTNTEAGAGGNGISSSTATAQSGIANANDDVDGGAGGDVSGSGATNSGSGGVGGDADSTAIASNTGGATVTANANADGAAGGNARGVGNTGGRGGMATATAQGSSTGGATTNVTASATGGAGGGGSDGAAAGAGGGAVVTDATSGSTSGSLSLTQTSSGGGGGNATGGGDGGRGGDASGTLTAGNAEGGTLSMTVTVNGGNGGNANDVGAAGDGGDPTLGPVVGTSPSGGTVTVTGTANGGDGGNATGTGAAGSGASVSVTDRVDGDTAGSLTLTQIVTGGNSGSVLSGASGMGGNASSSLAKISSSSFLGVETRATGGAGDSRTASSGKAASGGDASTSATATNDAGETQANWAAGIDAFAGNGGFGSGGAASGDGGSATNTSVATTSGDGNTALTRGGARGGAGGAVVDGTNTQAGAGGNATSTGTATALGSSTARAFTVTTGGAGGDVSTSGLTNTGSGGAGGLATSTSTVNGAGTLFSDSIATATGGAGGRGRGAGNSGGAGGDAIATSTGTHSGTNTLNIDASATGGAGGTATDGATVGLGGNAFATATGNGTGGSAESFTTTGASNGNLVSDVTSNALAPVGSVSTAEARSQVSGAGFGVGDAAGRQSAAFGYGAPDATVTLPNVIGNAVLANFDIPGTINGTTIFDSTQLDSDILGLGVLAGQYAENGSGASRTYSSQVDFDVDPSLLTAPEQLLLVGFMNPVVSGSGFTSLDFDVFVEGVQKVNQNFTSVSQALVFFDSQTIDIGDLTPTSGSTLDVNFDFSLTTDSVDDGFAVDFILGNSTRTPRAVPFVPTTSFSLGEFRVNDDSLVGLEVENVAVPSSDNAGASFIGTTDGGINNGGVLANLAPGASDNTTLQVGINTMVAGNIGGTTTVQLTTDGSQSGTAEVFGTTIINLDGTVFNPADPLLTTPVELGDFRVGDVAVADVTFTNNAPISPFSETLDASFTSSTSGDVTSTAGAVDNLAPQATSVGDMTVTMNTGAAGNRSGTAEINFVSDPDGINSLGLLDLGNQDVTVNVDVYRLAEANLTTPVGLADVHVGDAAVANVSISNDAVGDAFSEFLDASFTTTTTGDVTSALGSIDNLAPGGVADTSSMTVGMDTSTRGSKTGTAEINFVSDPNGVNTLAPFDLGNQDVTVNVDVYALADPLLLDIAFAPVMVGSAAPTEFLSVSNQGMVGDLFQEALNAQWDLATQPGFITSLAGDVMGLGSGLTDTTSMSATLDTSTQGMFSETVTVLLQSDGTAINTLGVTDLMDQGVLVTATVTGMVAGLAEPFVPQTSFDFGDARVGDVVALQNVEVQNVAMVPAEGLDAQIGSPTAGVQTNMGTITSLPPGGPPAGQDTTSLAVGIVTAQAGAIDGTATIDFQSDGSVSGTPTPLASQDINVTGEVYRLAEANLTTPVDLADVRVGDAAVANVSISNDAVGDAFSEFLDASFTTTTTGDVTSALGSIDNLAPGGVADTSSMTVTMDTSMAGNRTGTAEINFVSDPNGVNTLAPFDLGNQDVTVNVDVYALADPLLLDIAFAPVMVGSAAPTEFLSVSNQGMVGDLFQEALNAQWDLATQPGFITSLAGDVMGLGSGLTDTTSMSATLDTSTQGMFSETVTVLLQSDGTAINTLGVTDLMDQGVLVTATVTGMVAGLAEPFVPQTSFDFGDARVGDVVALQNVEVQNVAMVPAEGLDAQIGSPTAGVQTNMGTITSLPPGGPPAGQDTTSLAVGIVTAQAGAIDGTATIDFQSDGSVSGTPTPLASQDINVTGEVYRLAEANLTTPVDLADVRVGDAAVANVSISNDAVGDAFSEFLDASFTTTTTGDVTSALGSIDNLAPGGVADTSSMTVTMDTSMAGNRTGTAEINFVSDPNGVNTLAPFDLGNQDVTVNVDVYRLAEANLTTPVGLADVHVGDAAVANVSISNDAVGDAFSEFLDASFTTTTTGDVTSALGSIDNLAPGGVADTSSMTVTMDTSMAGNRTGTAEINFVSDPNGVNTLAPFDLGNQDVTVNVDVYALADPLLLDIAFAPVMVGSAAPTEFLSVSNQGMVGDLFQEALNAQWDLATQPGFITSLAGDVMGLGSGLTDTTSMSATLDTSTQGMFSETVTVLLQSDGTAINTLGVTDLMDQGVLVTATVTGMVAGLAEPFVPQTSFDFGDARVGDVVALQNVEVQNVAMVPAEGLDAQIGSPTAGVQTNMGTITSLPPGGPPAGQDTTSLAVGIVTAQAGAIDGTATIDFQSDGSVSGTPTPLASQDINVTGEVYRLAEANLTTPVDLADVRVGDAAVANVSTSNDAVGDAFSEFLDASFTTTTTGDVTSALGSIDNLAPGGVADTSSMTVTMDTSMAGNRTGTAEINFVSDPNGVNTLAPFDLGNQDVTVNVDVYRLAEANLTTPVGLADVRVGDAAVANVSISNDAVGDAFSEFLDASFTTTTTGDVTSALGSIDNLAPGGVADTSSMTVTMDTSMAGNRTGTAEINFVSDPNGVNTLAPFDLGNQDVTVNVDVYRLAEANLTTPVGLADVHVGDAAVANVSISNDAVGDAFSEFLDASFTTTTTGDVTSALGSIDNLAPGGVADTSSMTVTMDTSMAGNRTGTAEINFVSDPNGVNTLAPFDLGNQDVTVNVDVYALADPLLLDIAFAPVMVGSAAPTEFLSVSNQGMVGDLFQEALNAQWDLATQPGFITSLAGDVMGLGSGLTDTTSMSATLDTSTQGMFSETVTVLLQSDGTAINTLGVTDLMDQGVLVTATVTGMVAGLAEPFVPQTSFDLGSAHVGDVVALQNVEVQNVAMVPAEGLDAQIGSPTAGVQTNMGTITSLPPGGPPAGQDTTSLAVGIVTAQAGAIDGTATIDFQSDGSVSGTPTPLASQDISVTGNVFAFGDGDATATLDFAARRVGDAADTQTLSITNVGPDTGGFTEDLTANIGASPFNYEVDGSSGAQTLSGIGQGDTQDLSVALLTDTAGDFTGALLSIGYESNEIMNSGLGDTARGGEIVTLNGKVYTPAEADVEAGTTIDFGVVRVGDPVADMTRKVTNAAAMTALNDVLTGEFTPVNTAFDADAGPLDNGGLGPGGMTDVAFSLDTTSAGMFDSMTTLDLSTSNPDMMDELLQSVDYQLLAQVNNIANPVVDLDPGDGSLSGGPALYVLDFGNITEGSTDAQKANLEVLNDLSTLLPADLLAGMWSDAIPGAFDFMGFDAFMDVAAGAAFEGLMVSFDPTGLGVELYEGAITLNPFSTFPELGPLPLDSVMLEVRARIVGAAAVPEPQSVALMMLGLLLLLLMHGHRRRAWRSV